MPLALITIEEIGKDRWVADVEIGGFRVNRKRVTAHSRDEIFANVMEACRQLDGEQAPPQVYLRLSQPNMSDVAAAEYGDDGIAIARPRRGRPPKVRDEPEPAIRDDSDVREGFSSDP